MHLKSNMDRFIADNSDFGLPIKTFKIQYG